MSDYALRLEQVHVQRGDFDLRVDLELPEGYIMGLVGPNGAGKTTTIRTILGMLTPTSGTVEVLGRRLPAPAALREEIGVVLDQASLVEQWRLSQVEQALSPFYRAWDRHAYSDLLARFGLRASMRVGELSRGMTMKLQVAIALSHGARLLVLDEPTSGLDPVARDELTGILGEFLVSERHSVLFSTHITSDLERVADQITFLHEGRVWFSGATDELRDAYRLVRTGPDGIDPAIIECHGLRRSPTTAEALVPSTEVGLLGSEAVVERPSLDQIVVHLASKEAVA